MTQSMDPRDKIFSIGNIKDGLGRRTGKSAVTAMVYSAMKIILTIGSTAVLARYIPPAQHGIVAMALPAVLVTTSLAEFGFAQAIVQREHITHKLVSTLFWIGSAIGLAMTILVAVLGGPAAALYNQPEVTLLFVFMAPYILLSVISSQYTAILRRQMQIKLLERGQLIAMFSSTILAIIVAILGAGYWALVVQLLVAEIVNVIYLIIMSRWLPSRPGISNWRDAKGAISFGGFLAGERLLTQISRNLQLVIIGRVFGTVDAGLFLRAEKLARMPVVRVAAPLSGVFVPALSRLQDDPEAFCAMYARQISRGHLIMIPLGLLVIVCADVIVHLLLGPDWVSAGPVLMLMGLIPLFYLLQISLIWSLISRGQARALFYFRLCVFPMSIIGALIGAQYGLTGLVTGFLVAMLGVEFPVLLALALRKTALTARTLATVVIPDTLWALAALGSMSAARYAMDETLILEGLGALLTLAAVYATRVFISPTLRRDVFKVFGSK